MGDYSGNINALLQASPILAEILGAGRAKPVKLAPLYPEKANVPAKEFPGHVLRSATNKVLWNLLTRGADLSALSGPRKEASFGTMWPQLLPALGNALLRPGSNGISPLGSAWGWMRGGSGGNGALPEGDAYYDTRPGHWVVDPNDPDYEIFVPGSGGVGSSTAYDPYSAPYAGGQSYDPAFDTGYDPYDPSNSIGMTMDPSQGMSYPDGEL